MNPLLLPPKPPLSVVLVEPQIPQNTGNITRLCACTGAQLYLVGNLGFRLDDKFLDRAAMDYKAITQPIHLPTFEEAMAAIESHQQAQPVTLPGYTGSSAPTPYYLSSKATQSYTQITFSPPTVLVFGSEVTGLPEAFIKAHPHQALRIPMQAEARSLNLANSVAIVLYEVLRQWQLPEAQN